MKNSLLSICLLSMLALASTQAIASSETWDQKLDLTIPSLEMPSTSVLDSRAKQEITMGWTCCYHPTLRKRVQDENSWKLIELQLKESQNLLPSLQYREPPSTFDLSLFWTLQVLDVWSTNRALKCPYVMEGNPLLPEKPSLERLIVHKTVLLWPSYTVWQKGVWNKREVQFSNWIMSVVVMNNLEIVSDIRENC